jgi:hypothetical protein
MFAHEKVIVGCSEVGLGPFDCCSLGIRSGETAHSIDLKQPPSTATNRHQLPSTAINRHQPPAVIFVSSFVQINFQYKLELLFSLARHRAKTRRMPPFSKDHGFDPCTYPRNNVVSPESHFARRRDGPDGRHRRRSRRWWPFAQILLP